jgi:hypothetical protein
MNKLSLPPIMIVHWLLYATIGLLILGIGFAVSFTHQKLSTYVMEVDHLKIDSEINQQSIENARRLRQSLAENQESVVRAASIVADTKYYEYQDQIVQDITSYANASGVTVLGFDFTTTTKAQASKVKGLNTVVANISLKSPVQYQNYLRFLKLIEKNLTKMQVTQLEISNDLKSATTINSQLISLEVYVR